MGYIQKISKSPLVKKVCLKSFLVLGFRVKVPERKLCQEEPKVRQTPQVLLQNPLNDAVRRDFALRHAHDVILVKGDGSTDIAKAMTPHVRHNLE